MSEAFKTKVDSPSAHLFEKHPLPAAGLLGLFTLPIHLILPHE